jgi:hypothetical protein
MGLGPSRDGSAHSALALRGLRPSPAGDRVIRALNLTFKIRQTPEVLERLQHVKATFAAEIQPAIDAALRDSEIVHFARVLVIDDRYIQVLTEFDGDERVYTEFFRKQLPELFHMVFSLAERPLTREELADPVKFADYTTALNLPALGTDGSDHEGNERDAGYLFRAYPDVLVKDVLAKFPRTTG